MPPKKAQKKGDSKKAKKGETASSKAATSPLLAKQAPPGAYKLKRKRMPPSKCARMVASKDTYNGEEDAPAEEDAPEEEEAEEESENDTEQSNWSPPPKKRGPPRDDDDDAPPPSGPASAAGKRKTATKDSSYGATERGTGQSSAPPSKRVQTGQVHSNAATDASPKQQRTPRRKAPTSIDPTYRLKTEDETYPESEPSPLLSLKQRRKGLNIIDRSYLPSREEKRLIESNISPLPSPTATKTKPRSKKSSGVSAKERDSSRSGEKHSTGPLPCLLKTYKGPAVCWADEKGGVIACAVSRCPSRKAGRMAINGSGLSTFQICVN